VARTALIPPLAIPIVTTVCETIAARLGRAEPAGRASLAVRPYGPAAVSGRVAREYRMLPGRE